MDRFAGLNGDNRGDIPGAEEIRRAMGVTRKLSERIGLAAMTPHDNLSSSHYCLADPGREYLIYLLEGGTVTVDLTAVKGNVSGDWIDPVLGKSVPSGTVDGGARRDFKSPLAGDVALYLHRVR